MIAALQYGSIGVLLIGGCTLTIWLQNRRAQRRGGDTR